jgi:hypothetical protein
MKRFDKIKEILDTLVNGQNIHGHGAFWRGLSLDQFKSKKVFGYPLVVPGDSGSSNIVKALRGQSPFGADVGVSGAVFRRMPAGRSPADESQIEFIIQWIDDGCLDDEFQATEMFTIAGHHDLGYHNAYWREFDNRTMYEATADVEAAVNQFVSIVRNWFLLAKDRNKEADWNDAIADKPNKEAIVLLSNLQRTTVERFYGQPIDLDEVLDSYRHFGRGTLPDDPLRPQDPSHKMNGPSQWFIWSAFADACLRLRTDIDYWNVQSRAVLVGLLHDGLFRKRFAVTDFTADDSGSDAALRYVKAIPESKLQEELFSRYVQSGI